jgi:hypothetical protein
MPKIVWKYYGKQYEMEKRVWHGMRARCHNPKNQAYERYGGRGIFMCDEWLDNFDRFYEDMGPKPEGMDLDRIDNEKGYSKQNCQWISRKENTRNTRRTVYVDVNGIKLKLHQISDLTGQKKTTISYRLKQGLPLEQVLSTKKLPNSVRRGEQHGTYYEYQRWGCKCDPCKKAASTYKAFRYQERKKKSI